MEGTQGLQGFKIALLIDFDNVILGVEDPGFDIELVVNALRSRGSVVMGRAYGDWYRHNRHRRKLMEHGIELVETPVFGPVIKNSADIRIVLDGFEIAMLQHHIDAFCLVSGDSDFLPLIKKLQYLGKHVIVISGNKFTSDLVRRNCNEFVSYENLLAESLGATEDVSTLEGAFALLARGISTLQERGMEVRSSTVKQMMLQLNPAFSERNFSCAQFKQFLDKAVRAGVVRLGGRDQVSGEFLVFLPTDFDDDSSEAKPALSGGEPATFGRRADAAPPQREPRERETRDREPREREPRDGGRGRGRERRRFEAGERDEKPESVLPVEETQPESALPAGVDAAVTTLAGEVPIGEIKPTTSGHLLNRGLRRGRLRFSGKAGRAEVAEAAIEGQAEAQAATEQTALEQPETVDTDAGTPVGSAETTAPSSVQTPEAALEVQAEKVPDAQASTGESPKENPAEEAPKKRATRRGGKAVKAKAAKGKAKSETAEDTQAGAEPIATSAPTEAAASKATVASEATAAVETVPESAVPPAAPGEKAKRPTTRRTRSATKRTATSEATKAVPEVVEPVAAPVEVSGATPNPIEVGLAAADNKPARRRSRRK